MPVRLGDTTRQVNDSIEYPIVQATEVQVVDTAGNFGPPSVRSYKDLESVLAELASGSSSDSGKSTFSFTNSALSEGDAVYLASADTVDQADAADIDNAAIGICTELNTPSAGQCTVQFIGTTGVFGGLTTGERYILSTTPPSISYHPHSNPCL